MAPQTSLDIAFGPLSEMLGNHCSRLYMCVVIRHGHCVRGSRCENGLRSRHYYILSGSVLSVWTNVERAVASRMQIIRLRTDDGKKIVGQSFHLLLIRSFSSILQSAENIQLGNAYFSWWICYWACFLKH